MKVLERGWLSANNILFQGATGTAVVDTGYWSHGPQTLALIRSHLGTRPLDFLLNTHLHSDHCGGNSMLQAVYPQIKTFIPPGQAPHVRNWDPVALTYAPTGQECPRFLIDGLLEPGQIRLLGEAEWEIHSSPGHDPHSVVLFEPLTRTLISADALWENGFGVVFQELEGQHAFEDVARTLTMIEELNPSIVVPGHGKVFTHVAESISAARRRLNSFVTDPRKHAAHAAKVLLKFKLLELQQTPLNLFTAWAIATPYFGIVHARYFADRKLEAWLDEMLGELVRVGAARRAGTNIINA